MTGPRRSPPRTKKESSDADDDEPGEPDVANALADRGAQQEARRRARSDKRLVEAPRTPKVTFAQKRQASSVARRAKRDARLKVKVERRLAKDAGAAVRQDAERARTAGADPRTPASDSGVGARRAVALAASTVGGVGLACSVLLALGALLLALGVDESHGLFAHMASWCDLLVGPLRDLISSVGVSFSGNKAAAKLTLLAWGMGSIGYLVVGIAVQALLRTRLDDVQ